ncbi:TetR/AcrR family transcriptional regulator [Mangrovicella endophytica]|uniref:TetR/AcrR family transcriptional regulator n=1 Tax=Mangrovicella endophytica TaxID=2066697 RepID=UPI000C9E7A14|nr:TetR/AcrR family transcriptional regulator [Mangrovicella endophytica]
MQNDDAQPAPPDTGARPRGRPRAFDREAALAEATRLFWAKGYEATSIAELTQAMGIGGPSLYAAFGSKEALYVEALRHYSDSNAALVWTSFERAETARDAVRGFLMDSAAALGGGEAHPARGCMVTLSSVGSEGHEELGRLVCEARGVTLERLKARLAAGVDAGEIAATTDIHALARFVQTVQNGMSILARDGARCDELRSVAEVAMLTWDACTRA